MSLAKFLEAWKFRRIPLSRTGVGHFEAVFRVEGGGLSVGGLVPRISGLLAMDLTHVNEALAQKGAAPVDVVLGVDVFDAHAAVIDYGSASLFLRDA